MSGRPTITTLYAQVKVLEERISGFMVLHGNLHRAFLRHCRGSADWIKWVIPSALLIGQFIYLILTHRG